MTVIADFITLKRRGATVFSVLLISLVLTPLEGSRLYVPASSVASIKYSRPAAVTVLEGKTVSKDSAVVSVLS
ncbi:MAG TPA: hypothetical protein PKK94_11055 [Leptospiraceae bacterium]|nr:hypothetical protein [Leptospiraceae bacterium]